MQFQFTIYFWILFFSAALSLTVALMIWRNRRNPGGRSFFLMMLAVAEWSLAAGLEAAAIGETAKFFWSKWEHLGSNATAVFFLLFAIEYTGYGSWLTKTTRKVIWYIPILNMLLAASDSWHGLVWAGFTPSAVAENMIIYHHGPGFFFITFIIYGYLAVASLLLIITAFRASKLQQKQIFILVLAAVIPWIASIIYLSDISPLPGLNIIPSSLVFVGIFMGWSVFRFRFLDLIPVARDLLLEKVGDGIMVLDSRYRLVDMNQAAEVLIHLPRRKAIGLPVFEICGSQPELLSLIHSKSNEKLEIEWFLNKEKHIFDVRITPIKDWKGDIAGQLLIWHDITENKHAEQEREAIIKDLENANATRDRFFSIISHDLRNPFNVILSFVSLIKSSVDTLSRDEIVELTDELYNSTEKTRLLLENLLSWSQSQIGSLKFNPGIYHFKLLAQSVFDLVENQANAKDIKIESKIAKDISVYADNNMTSTILRNLFSNAIKFTPKGGMITLETERDNNKVVVHVKDNGVGIDKSKQDLLFKIENKTTTDGTDNERGSGIGLILCKELVEKQGGEISVQSVAGEGSVFSFTIPAAPNE